MTKASGIIACVVLGLTSFALPACSSKSDGGTPSKEDQCKAYYKAECDKVYECFSAAEIAKAGGALGTGKEDCPAALESANPCTQDPCEAGQTYNSAKATECTNAIGATTCSDLMASEDGPAACNEVCTNDTTPSGAGGGDTSGSAGGSNTGNDGAAIIAECKKVYSLQCHKIFTCFTADQLAAAADSIGNDETECATLLETDTPCTADLCGDGTLDATQANSCNAALTAQTCDDFTAQADVTECSSLCSN